MNKLIRSAMAAMMLFIGTQGFSQTKTPPAPVKVASVEGITEYKLANGLRVLLFPDPSKSTITVNITYLVGSRMEGYGETGMAHLLEHMVFKGSTNHKNIPQELTAHGARPNGTTWYDRTNYFESFNATEENLRWALSLESDRMVNSFIAKKDLESEFSVVRNEFERGENDPGSVLMERVISTAYLWHNYGKSTIGSKEDIERVPIENLKAFYKKYYQPDNAVLTIAGKIDEPKALQLVNEYFGVIPKPERKLQETFTVEPTQDGERSVVLRRVGDVQMAACGYHIPSGSSPDYAAVEVLVEALTNEPAGRLYKALIETKKASSTYGYAFQLKDPGFAYFAAEVLKDKSVDTVMNTMTNLFDNLSKNPFTKEEVDRAKNTLSKDLMLQFNNSDRVGLALSEYIALGDWRLYFIYRDALEKVTPADVNRVAAEYFKPSNRTTGLFIPEAKPDRAVIPASPDVNALVKDYKGNKALTEAEAFDPSPSNIESRIKKATVSGGAKYTLLKKTTRGGNVSVRMTMHIGNPAVLQNKGLASSFTADMLKRGTKNKSFQQINDEIDRLKSNVSINGSGQEVNINITTTKENLNGILNLVNEMIKQPAFSQQEFDKLKEEQLASIDQQRSEPQSIASNLFEKTLNPYPKEDFRYVMSFDEEKEALNKLTIDDVKNFYNRFYSTNNATVAIVGDFDEPSLIITLNNLLDKWGAPVLFDRAKDLYFDVTPVNEKINTPDKANALMLAGMNLELRDDDADYPALVIGNYMLGGGFLNSRLATRIRQKEGISYGVGSQLQAGSQDKSGGFITYAIYNPDNSERLIEAYKDEMNKMVKDGFTKEELADAVKGFIQSRSVSRSQDRELCARLNNYIFLDRTMKWDEDFEKKIQALTVEQVNAAMRKWINPEKISYIQAGDFNRKK
ncbi:MAG: insulinase family protein [Bacteroidetes bacterium]|nr:insulinase family protein [Bacteroidia bacterium]MCO5288429.1 insulinase family protein [Bacteroidota bacterium]MCW5932050.1 insulinase family protein [Bacteroidota bacterium]HRV53306.1 pitrilysin family protein [Bacteroidia bacterium]